jgi:DNA invertase Pin-like site-specific DNA recombinase
VRVSTAGQAERGISLEAQEERLRAYASLYDLELVDVIVDAGESAGTLDRPGLRRALAMLKAGQADGLLVAKLDRLTRSVRDLGTLVETSFKDHALLSVAEQVDTRTSSGRLVLNVLASVSQWEREAIGERTSNALRHKQSRGEYTGGDRPFGYRVEDGRLVEDEAEQATIRRARELRAAGLPLRKIADSLHSQGLTSRKLHPETVSRLLSSRRATVAA